MIGVVEKMMLEAAAQRKLTGKLGDHPLLYTTMRAMGCTLGKSAAMTAVSEKAKQLLEQK